MRLLEWERLDRRVLGAIRFVDATTELTVRRSLPIEAVAPTADLRLRLIRNRSFDYVIQHVRGLEAHLGEFEAPPAVPAPGAVSVSLGVTDPAGQYLPRTFALALPRDPDPANAEDPDSLFQAVRIPLYPSPVAAVGGNWSVLRLALTQPPQDGADAGAPVAGALLRVMRQADDEVLARGMSDARGQTLIVVPGIPVTRFGNGASTGGSPPGPGGGSPPGGGNDPPGLATGPVVVLDTAVTLQIIVAPDLPWPADPATLEANAAAWARTPESPASLDFNLRTGRSESVAVVIDMTDGS